MRGGAIQIWLVLLACASAACNPVYYVGAKLIYKGADLPVAQRIHDFSYAVVPGDPKQQLDLFVPQAPHWPIVIFVHGGSWTAGDRALRVGGADVYRNIGRFLAQNGIGAAVLSYRLVPAVDWRAQSDDVLQAVRWVYNTAVVYGARRDAIFVAGHSAGAQLAARSALDTESLTRAGVPPSAIRGMFLVSGAGYDLADQTTYDLGHDRHYYADVFGPGAKTGEWEAAASPIRFVGPHAPASVIMGAEGDDRSLKRQNQVFYDALVRAGARTRFVEVPGTSHARIVPMLSRSDRPAGAALVAFVWDEMARLGQPRP